MFLVGLTGGIATGKSTVSSMFRELGCPIIDADLAAREVVKPHKKAWNKIKAHFGPEVLLGNSELNRARLGEIIFSDPEKRKLLNSITHPEIYKHMIYEAFTYFFTGSPFVILDLPLLFETGSMVPYMSKIIVVSCDDETQLQRLKQRNNFTDDEANSRISSQMALETKRKRASYVINNSKTLVETKQQVEQIFRELGASKLHWRLRIILVSCLVGLFCISCFSVQRFFGA
ncbi:dephospho-CoA kinase domain-containing protein-like [Lineus longissimus]|uniref:dephospho-CoA kinase domain-containing protein-like n=1 Tax=Lineus longissimus TaxID=88925 RepID=UPI002B4E46E0